MLDYNELRAGVIFIYNDQPYEVIESQTLRMQQRKPVMQARIRNLLTGVVMQQNFHQNEKFEEAEVDKIKIKFLYSNRGEYWFSLENDPSKRFSLSTDLLGSAAKYMKANMVLESLYWNDQCIHVGVPVKMELKVTEAAPAIKGDTANNATKTVKLETGAEINVPMFINQDDIIMVNTETDLYVERVSKA